MTSRHTGQITHPDNSLATPGAQEEQPRVDARAGVSGGSETHVTASKLKGKVSRLCGQFPVPEFFGSTEYLLTVCTSLSVTVHRSASTLGL